MPFPELTQALRAALERAPGSFDPSGSGPADARDVSVLTLRPDRQAVLGVSLARVRFGRHQVQMLAFHGSAVGPILVAEQGSTASVEVRNDTEWIATAEWLGLHLDARPGGGSSGGQNPGVAPVVEPGRSALHPLAFPAPGVYGYRIRVPRDGTQTLDLCGAIVVRPTEPEYWQPVDRVFVATLDEILLPRTEMVPLGKIGPIKVVTGRYGSVLLVNGVPDGRFEMRQGDVARFHVINVAKDRSFNVRIPGARIKHVGADHGRVERERFVEEVLLGPAERAVLDVFFPRSGSFEVQTRTPGRSTQLATASVTPAEEMARHRVSFETLRYNSEFATERAELDELLSRAPDRALRISKETSDVRHAARPMGPTEWTFEQGSRVKLRVQNATDLDDPRHHSFHVQGQRFLVLARDGVPSDVLAWKDTLRLRSGEVADLLVEMSHPGTWTMHVHSGPHLEASTVRTFHVHEPSDSKGRNP